MRIRFLSGRTIIFSSLGNTISQVSICDHSLLQIADLLSTGRFSFTDELLITRAISTNTGTRLQSFCGSVRLRDRRCIITGEEAIDAEYNDWVGFQVAHIVSLAFQGYWDQHDFSR